MSDKTKEGLPDVASKNNHRPFVIIIMVVALILIALLYLFNKTENKSKKATEEVYVAQVEPPIVHKTETVSVPETKNVIPLTTQQPINPETMQQQLALIQEKQKVLRERLSAPLMLVNNNQVSKQAPVLEEREKTQDPNNEFMRQVANQNIENVTASKIGPLNTLIAQGTFIQAILESATDSDLPGALRAVVREPVYAEDGSQVLITPGSRLIGEYKSGILQGQSRIFIVWTRVITPHGISVQLGSPGVDNLGVAGMGADDINRHFWQRFGTASLLSLIGAGASNVGVKGQDENNSASLYREAVGNSFSQSASQSLQQDSMIAPTLKTYQGKPIMVFVAKDIHFADVMSSIKPKTNVFPMGA